MLGVLKMEKSTHLRRISAEICTLEKGAYWKKTFWRGVLIGEGVECLLTEGFSLRYWKKGAYLQ